MKNTYQNKTFHGNQYVPSNKDKVKLLQVWAFVIMILGGTAYGQITTYFNPLNVAHAETVEFDPTEGLDLFKGDIIIKEGKDPAWGVIKEPKTIKARVTWYSVADSCHFPAKDGGCYSANYPHKIQRGDMACPKGYKFGTKIEYDGVTYTCNDRTADWVQGKWTEPTFDIFVPKSSEVIGVKYTTVTIK